MTHKNLLISEGEALDEFLDELQQEQEIVEIAGLDCGFAKLNCALDGILPGLYSLMGPPGSGKTSFAKQLLDQVAMRNDVVGIFFSFIESKKEIRIKTLARLSGIENREIRRGSAYLLHWYGVPRLAGPEAEQLSPSWEKIRRCAENARDWLSSIYLVECGEDTTTEALQAQASEIRAATNKQKIMIVVDDCHRLRTGDQTLQARILLLTEQLYSLVKNLNAALLAVWPSVRENVEPTTQTGPKALWEPMWSWFWSKTQCERKDSRSWLKRPIFISSKTAMVIRVGYPSIFIRRSQALPSACDEKEDLARFIKRTHGPGDGQSTRGTDGTDEHRFPLVTANR